MTGRPHDEGPLALKEVEEYESDLISFCDRELDLLGDITGLRVLYAGGSSPLWLEGLSQRIGRSGTLTALDADEGRVENGRQLLREADLAAPVKVVRGDVFQPPFPPGSFDLIYSAGLFHELDTRNGTAGDALLALAAVTRPGGRVATSDFVNAVPAAQLEDEEFLRELAREVRGTELYGIGPPERLVALHEAVLDDVRWRVLPSHPIRYLGKVFLAEEEPEGLEGLPARMRRRLRARYEALRGRVAREGYTRPSTLYVQGLAKSG